jgi:hypothetical protein
VLRQQTGSACTAVPRGTVLEAVGGELRMGENRRNDPCPCGSGLKYKRCSAAALAALCVVLNACGSNSGSGNSDYYCAAGTSACIQYRGLSGAALANAKAGCFGTWASGDCSTVSIVGGCILTPTQIFWYYQASGKSVADVMATCLQAGATFSAGP